MLLNKKDVNQKKADCWSVGIILYQLLYGEHPFEKPSDQEEGSVKRTLDRIVKACPLISCLGKNESIVPVKQCIFPFASC